MGSVEELCDNIALIHKSKKILDGPVKEIRKQFKSNTFELEFTGNLMGFTNALWSGAELIDHTIEDDHNKVRVKLLGRTTANDLLQAIIPVAQIQSFKEIVPSMNDIFIAKVNAENPLGTQNNFTE